jgi:phosphoenolpyruvate carboxykinase (GTP)
MLPFMGYNAGDYANHWLEVGEATPEDKRPKLFWVNWFRKDQDGKFMWPGFGDNIRVLDWVLQRVAGQGDAVETPIGLVPTIDAIDRSGLDLDDDKMAAILDVDRDSWKGEIPLIADHFDFIGERLPDALKAQLDELEDRLAQG